MRHLLHLMTICSLAACGASSQSPAQSADPPFVVTPVASFDSPWALAFLPGGTQALVTETAGKIWLVDTNNGRKQPVSGAPRVRAGGQGGLLDIVLSPHFSSDRMVYLTYSEPSPAGGSGLALARASFGGSKLTGLQVIWRDPEGGSGGQFGGVIAFAPDGNSLFLTSGDRQRFTDAQDPSAPLGKILHLSLDGKAAAGNPWAGRAGSATVQVTDPPSDTEEAKSERGETMHWPGLNPTPSETWTLGHRNPYGLAFDAAGRLWETEMGPRGGDELNLILPGKNYGWPLVSEGRNYDGVPIPKHSTRPDIVPPKLFWDPVISPTSLVFYSGNLFPQWKGSAFIGSLSQDALVRVTFNGETARKAEQWDLGARIRWVGQGPDGALYVLEDRGRLLRLLPAKP